ncbi:hypothetical protein BVRB_5g125300 isoform B [Beta vulgaris subsp. vulgaris]|uniref:RanBP2-type domain-containing protein n=1 Tax=Beta vulgaris subsp. vulgaris TaxID=3555 RepID=A0A0J8B8L7_BETVV|nr:hypothetical protein BVRB_5g125300 isoform B [Beta vulgaris subsp. vulgaris]
MTMGGATVRLFTLLPLFHPRRPSSLLFLRSLVSHKSSLFLFPLLSLPPSPFLSPPKCSHQLHTQIPSLNSISGFDSHHPWPEFTDFVHWVSRLGYSNAPLDVHQFVDVQLLPQNFLQDANACLAFARDHPALLWSLPREDIEVVVENGSPFLFINASAAAARMKSFLGGGTNDVLASDEPSTADLVEFLLSYAHTTIKFPENMQIHSRVESSVRKLFNELANSNGSSVDSVATAQFSERYRCSFMNFAKNSECLQCDELRPKKFVSGEWECPQCNFLNFGRNVVCLRCDCKKSGVNSFLSPTSVSGLGADISVKGYSDDIIPGSGDEQQWFTKIAQLELSSELRSSLADEDFPETMKAEDNRYSASKGNLGIVNNYGPNGFETASAENSINVKISQSLDELVGEKSSPSATSTFVYSQYGKHSEPKSGLDTYAPVEQQMLNEKSSRQRGNKDYKREKDEKSEQWFKKVGERQAVNKDLPSAISDDDFPEIMPIHKAENRFVVSKKKDRSLTSPMYKRRVVMEQAGSNYYVPFVPFPPGYFANEKSREGSESIHANEQTGPMSSDAGGAGERKEGKYSDPVFEASNNVNQNPKYFESQFRSPDDDSKSQSLSENASVGHSWRERSLEGSAVKEPDLLDMSEEAKAERWFRRVAQIKDISELSQIPDEDFPSIMPMRKGVNRFVVSKRKSPLERRLTSSQYPRNLPVVNSDSVREETDSD